MDSIATFFVVVNTSEAKVFSGILLHECPNDTEEIDDYVELIAETCASRQEYIWVNGEDVPIELVRKRFLKLDGGAHPLRHGQPAEEHHPSDQHPGLHLGGALQCPVTISQYYTVQISRTRHRALGGRSRPIVIEIK